VNQDERAWGMSPQQRGAVIPRRPLVDVKRDEERDSPVLRILKLPTLDLLQAHRWVGTGCANA
jgi:hypothetical protein